MPSTNPRSRSQRIEVIQLDPVTKENLVNVVDTGVIGPPGYPGVGLPTGGTAPQVLTKNSNTSYDFSFATMPAPTGITNEQWALAPANTVKCPAAGVGRPSDQTVDQTLNKLSQNLPWNQIGSILVNGWVEYGSPYGPPRVRILSLERIEIRGLISGGAVGSVIGTMFVGYRPAYNVIVNAACAGGTCEVRVGADGVITVPQITSTGANPTSWLSLHEVKYSILA